MLGPLEIRTDEGWIEVSASKWRTVLAVLLLNAGQAVSTDLLVSEAWEGSPPARASNAVSICVHRLRRLMGDHEGRILVTRAPGYQLILGEDDLDARKFTRLAAAGRAALASGDGPQAADLLTEALSLWRGKALADVPHSPLVSAEASRLEESRVEALELRIQADLACGRQAQVVLEARRLLADHPLREGLWALLMRALYAAGRQAEALDVYAKAREVIADQLGVDPSAELQNLYQRMLAADAGSAPLGGGSQSPDSPFAVSPPDSAGAPSGSAPSGSAPSGSAPSGSASAEPAPAVPASAADPLPQVAQLPADISDFTGRTRQVESLRQMLSGPRRADSPGAVVVAAVIGTGGLGKTTLAVHAAHLLRGQFPDGQLYAGLLGATQHPAAPGDVLARFLRDLGMDPARIPAGEEERAAHYRSRLTERRVLIVLDDARDAAQVRPLLPGSASCAVLVTTRSRMPDLAGSRFVDLDVLDTDEARDMFASIIGPGRADAEPEATDDVLAACAGLPLAIRIAAARLAARGNWTVRSMAGRLSDQRRRLDELKTGDLAVRACFEVSFSSLPDRARPHGVNPARAFRLLGLWQGVSIGLPAAAALLGQPEEAVAEALEVLVDAQLLQSPAPDRYRFHDLLRAYAADRAQAEEPAEIRDEAMRRVLTWYLHTMAAVARVISAHGAQVSLGELDPSCPPLSFSSVDEALDWCESERTNLVPATRLAAGLGLHDVAWKLPVAALGFFNRRTHWEEWLTTHQIALDSVRRVGDKRGEAWVLNNIGMAFARQGRDEGISYFKQALAIRREIGDRQGEAQAANNVAYANLLLKRVDEALHWLYLALDLQREVGHRFGEGVALNNLGEAYLELGRLDEAIDWLGQALTVYREIGARPAEGDTLSNLGKAKADLGHMADALDYLRQAEQTHHAVGDRYGEATDLKQLGEIHRLSGHMAEASQAWRRSLDIFELLGNSGQALEMADRLRELGGGTGG
jgi:DNA-binding SARP family transcriptional activator